MFSRHSQQRVGPLGKYVLDIDEHLWRWMRSTAQLAQDIREGRVLGMLGRRLELGLQAAEDGLVVAQTLLQVEALELGALLRGPEVSSKKGARVPKAVENKSSLQ